MDHTMIRPEDFFSLADIPFPDLFEGTECVWEALAKRDAYILDNLRPNIDGTQRKDIHIEGDVYIGKGTVIEPGAYIKGPTIIGNHCEIRHGAYIRGNVIIGSACVIGHGTEVIRSIMLNNVRADHFAYIGDSILGNNCHLGAGVILANVKLRINSSSVKIKVDGKTYDTGMRKLGGILGDNAEIGCNITANPGAILAKGVTAYPGTVLHGYYPPRAAIRLYPQKDDAHDSIFLGDAWTPPIESIVCPNCGEQISTAARVEEMIAYCKDFFGQCSCGQKYHIGLSYSGNAILSLPDRQIEIYLQFPDREHAALGRLRQ